MKHIILLALSIFLFAGCSLSQETLATQTTDAETPTSTPTVTSTPTETNTPTPETPRPAMSPELAPITNASMAYENGTWVTKNTAGKTSSTWDRATSEWTYNYENITTEYSVVGWPEGLPLELTRDSHPECFVRVPHEERLNLIDANGTSYPDGFMGEMTYQIFTRNAYIVRFVTSFNLNSDSGSMLCTHAEIGPDRTFIVPIFVRNTPNYSFRDGSYKLLQNDPMKMEGIGLTNDQIWNIIRSLPPGQQFMFLLAKDEPLDTFFAAMENPSDFTSQTLTVGNRIIYYFFGFPERFYTP